MLRFGHRGRCDGEDVFARTMGPDVDEAESCCRIREWVYLVSWSRSVAGVAYPCEAAMLAGMTESAKAEGVDVGDILGESVEDRVELSVFTPDVLFVSLFCVNVVVKNLFRFRCDVLLSLSSDSRAMLFVPFNCRSGLDVGGVVSSTVAGADCSPLGERWRGV